MFGYLARSLAVLLLLATVASAEEIVVTSPTAKIMSGRDVVGQVRQGQSFEVLETRGAWLRVQILVQGKARLGWISQNDVRREADWRSLSRDQLLNYAEQLWQRAHALSDDEKKLEASVLGRRLIEICTKVHGENHVATGASYQFTAANLLVAGSPEKAKPLAARAIEIYKSAVGDTSSVAASGYHTMGQVLRFLREFEASEKHLLRAIVIYSKLPEDSSSDLGWVYMDLGRVEKDRLNFPAARKHFEQALEVLRTSDKEGGLTTAVISEMAQSAFAEGDYPLTRKLYEQCLERSQARQHTIATGMALNNLSTVEVRLGEYLEARKHQEQALEIYRQSLGEKNPLVANAYSNLGVFYNQIGDQASAEPVARRALEVRSELLGEHSPITARTRVVLAASLVGLGRFDEAKSEGELALQDLTAHYGQAHEEVAAALDTLAALFINHLRDLPKSLEFRKRAYQIRTQVLGEDHPETAISMLRMALSQFRLGKYDEARSTYQQAIANQRQTLGDLHPEVSAALTSFSLVEIAQNDLDAAEAMLDEANRAWRHHLTHYIPGLDIGSQLKYLDEEDQASYDLTYAVRHSSRPSAARLSAGWVLNRKGMTQETLAQRALLAREPATPELKALVAELQQARVDLARAGVRSVTPEQRETHERLLNELATREAKLSARLGEAGLDVAPPAAWIELDKVRERLPQDAALVEMVRFNLADLKTGEKVGTRYAAWIIPPAGRGEIKIVDLGEAESIEAAVAQARHAIDSSAENISKIGEVEATQKANSALREVAKQVMDPLLPHLQQVDHLILSPDGSLWLLPWAALPLENGKLAVQRFRLTHVVTGRDVLLDSDGTSSGAAMIVADPDFDAELPGTTTVAAADANSDSAIDRRSAGELLSIPQVQRLPGTRLEATVILPSVKKLTGRQPNVYLDRQASEQIFKQTRSPQVLSFCTHGFFLEQQTDKLSGYRNPLLRSGLLLAGSNQRAQAGTGQEDGVLTALEIIGTDLRGTELVVLSACETGLGELRNGEGVAGLRQAFQLAGAESVVATLWQIPDQETARLMQAFFEHLAAGQSRGQALRQAQLDRIAARTKRYGAAHPFHWAAFTLTGRDS